MKLPDGTFSLYLPVPPIVWAALESTPPPSQPGARSSHAVLLCCALCLAYSNAHPDYRNGGHSPTTVTHIPLGSLVVLEEDGNLHFIQGLDPMVSCSAHHIHPPREPDPQLVAAGAIDFSAAGLLLY